MSLYAQLDDLARCGIMPNEGVGISDLLARHPERQYETDPFRLLVSVLGEESSQPPYDPLCDRLWHLRVGCISGSGDYTRIALRMGSLAGQSLPIANVHDEFDLASGIAYLTFELSAQQVSWPARIRECWVDPAIFSRFAALLDAQDSPARFTYLDLGGQDVLIGCATPAEFTEFRRRTGLKLEWLG